MFQAWELDAHVHKVRFLKGAMKAIVLGGLKKLLAPAVDPVSEYALILPHSTSPAPIG